MNLTSFESIRVSSKHLLGSKLLGNFGMPAEQALNMITADPGNYY